MLNLPRQSLVPEVHFRHLASLERGEHGISLRGGRPKYRMRLTVPVGDPMGCALSGTRHKGAGVNSLGEEGSGRRQCRYDGEEFHDEKGGRRVRPRMLGLDERYEGLHEVETGSRTESLLKYPRLQTEAPLPLAITSQRLARPPCPDP